jgi:SAM-dependent methyltransferase
VTTTTEAGPKATADYWDRIADEWGQGRGSSWRAVSDAVNGDLIGRWLPPVPGGSVLKTDLFDELAGTGLVPRLLDSFAAVAGIDVSPGLVARVRERHPRLDARVADVRRLPFEAEGFDAVVSNSTLDHFASVDEIGVSLRELHRVLRPGGTLLVTLDNGMNPIVAARNALPARWRSATGLVPYQVGATCRRPRELRALLQAAGFDVAALDAVMHCPRVIGVIAGSAVDRRAGAGGRSAYARALVGCEGLSRLPSRFVTGHFLAALAVKRPQAAAP